MADLGELGGNVKDTMIGISKIIAKIPGNPIIVSRKVDANNNIIDENGNIDDHPAPTLIPGLFIAKSEMGRDFERDPITDEEIKPSFIESLTSGTKANPILKFINHTLPGGKSATAYHDVGMTVEKGQAKKSNFEKAWTIAPYFLENYYGSIGTILDYQTYFKDDKSNSQNKP